MALSWRRGETAVDQHPALHKARRTVKRRDLIAMIGSTVGVRPRIARAQQSQCR
jgi:hypothetical protein